MPKWLEQILEQFGHAAWGALIATTPALYGAPVWACCLASVVCILPREFIDQAPINRPLDTALDIAFFGVGGALIGWAL